MYLNAVSPHSRLCLIWVHADEKSTLWPFPKSKIMQPAFSQQVLQQFPLNSEIVPLLEGLAAAHPLQERCSGFTGTSGGSLTQCVGAAEPRDTALQEVRTSLNLFCWGGKKLLKLCVWQRQQGSSAFCCKSFFIAVSGHSAPSPTSLRTEELCPLGALQTRICSASRQNPPSVVQAKHGNT